MNSLLSLLAVVSLAVAVPIGDDDIKITATDVVTEPLDFPHLPPSPALIVDDIEVDPHRNVMRPAGHKWANGVVPYVIDSHYPAAMKATIEAGMREIEHDVNGAQKCIQFVPRTNQANYLNIVPRTGCHSIIGFANKGPQEVSLASGCGEQKSVVMHELMHSLGFYHEHARPDRDTYITVFTANIEAGKAGDFQKQTTADANTLGTPYDFGSIMHYGPYSMAKDKSKPVMAPKPGHAVGVQMGQRLFLSNNDVIRIQKYYGCPQDTSHITRVATNTANIASCNFETNFCQYKHTAGADFHWARKRGASASGPGAGSTNGGDVYLLATASGHGGKVAKLDTPTFTQGSACLDFHLFQKGTGSYLEVSVTGPRVSRQSMRSFRGDNKNEWRHQKLNINVPSGIEYTITFEAHMNGQDLAVDDIVYYKGPCL